MTKSEFVVMRCDPLMRTALVTLAHQDGVNLSEALRRTVARVAVQRGLWPVAVADGEQEQVSDENG